MSMILVNDHGPNKGNSINLTINIGNKIYTNKTYMIKTRTSQIV